MTSLVCEFKFLNGKEFSQVRVPLTLFLNNSRNLEVRTHRAAKTQCPMLQVLGLKEGRLVMRRTEGIREWQRGLQRLSGGDQSNNVNNLVDMLRCNNDCPGGRMERTEGFWAKLESGKNFQI